MRKGGKQMRLPKRGERGFTLIELLIVVAILGVLAAVVIPNVQRFIGAGEEEAAETELSTVQTAVVAMMVDNQVSELAPVPTATNNMNEFPDMTTSDPLRATFATAAGGTELEGYRLYGNQIIVDHDGDGEVDPEVTGPPLVPGDGVKLVNYVVTPQTAYWYTITADGTVSQSLTAPAVP